MTERLTSADQRRGSFAVDLDPFGSVELPKIGTRLSNALVTEVQVTTADDCVAEIDALLEENPVSSRLAHAGVVSLYEEADNANTSARGLRDPLFLTITRAVFKQGLQTPGHVVYTASEMVPTLQNASPGSRVDYLARRGFARLQDLLTPAKTR